MDIYQRQGLPPYGGNLPVVPGAEGTGTVAAVGPDVSGVDVGDWVVWTGVPGSYAERALIPADRGGRPRRDRHPGRRSGDAPGRDRHYLCIDTFPVAEGDVVVVVVVVVVHAAAGGVGLLLTQLVKRRGGTVVATTSTNEKADLARQASRPPGRLRGLRRGGQPGFGRRRRRGRLRRRRQGHLRPEPRGAATARLHGAVRWASGPVPRSTCSGWPGGGFLFITRPTMAHYVAKREELLRRAGDLFSWIGKGQLQLRIGATYPLEDAARAQEDLSARRTTGKLLLLPG
jgi:NADPH:quinone reductase